ncbi:MAG: aminotransferase class V-fold PLP-dependent enzyme, partial [Clostridia bacterium]|nr:aminotransferase class V-fold PLP-dependent enzyme [Clostridia bacterium]
MYYFDNAATTKPYDECLDVYSKFSRENWFNPSALYFQSVESAKLLKGFRDDIKHALGASDNDDLYFTSGGTESDNWSLFASKKQRGGKIIVSLGEHDAIINPANELKAQGYDVYFAPINKDGSVNIDEFKEMLDESVCFVSIMHVSNETGAVNDIQRLVKLVKKANPDAIFHSDGVQAFCKVPVNVRALGVDLYSISGHKIHAPKGIGALYVKNGTKIKPFL